MAFTSKKYDDCKESVFPTAYDFDDDNYMQDLSSKDWFNVKQYENALNSGDETSATIYYNQIDDVEQKIFSASRWNKLRDAIKATQKYFIEEIEQLFRDANTFISEKSNEIKEMIEQLFQQTGTYDSYKTYYRGDIATYVIDGDTYSYLCNNNSTQGIVPTNTAYWTCLTIKGDKGDPGAYNPKGEYQNDVTYYKYDCVAYNGASYIAIDTVANVAPDSDDTKWQVFIKSGLTNADTVNGVKLHPKNVGTLNTVSKPWFYAFEGGDDYNCYVKNTGDLEVGNSDKLGGLTASKYRGNPDFVYTNHNGGDLNDFKTEYQGFVFNMTNKPSACSYGFLNVDYFDGTGFAPASEGVVRQTYMDWQKADLCFVRFYTVDDDTWSNWIKIGGNADTLEGYTASDFAKIAAKNLSVFSTNQSQSNYVQLNIGDMVLKIAYGRAVASNQANQTILYGTVFQGVPTVLIDATIKSFTKDTANIIITNKDYSQFTVKRNEYRDNSVDEDIAYIDWVAIGI